MVTKIDIGLNIRQKKTCSCQQKKRERKFIKNICLQKIHKRKFIKNTYLSKKSADGSKPDYIFFLAFNVILIKSTEKVTKFRVCSINSS